MNLLPGLQIVLDELTQRFGAQIEHAHAPQSNELYLHTKPELAGALCSVIYKKFQGRLAGVFAEDARAEHKVFFVSHSSRRDEKSCLMPSVSEEARASLPK